MTLSPAARLMAAQDADPATAPSLHRAAGGAATKRLRVESALMAPCSGAQGVDSHDVGPLAEEEAFDTLAAVAGQNIPAAVPRWVRPILAAQQAQMAQMNAALQAQLAQMNAALQAQLAQLKAGVNTVIANQTNADARLTNSLMDLGDTLVPLRTPAGIAPVGFPAKRADILRLTGEQLSRLLIAYGQPVPASVERRQRAFAMFIGVRLS